MGHCCALLHTLVHDDSEDEGFELELPWIDPETNGHFSVAKGLFEKVDKKGRDALGVDTKD